MNHNAAPAKRCGRTKNPLRAHITAATRVMRLARSELVSKSKIAHWSNSMMTEKIVRRWEARAPESAVQEWLVGFRKIVLPKMLGTEGFLGVSILVSRGDDPRQIAVFTSWDGEDALVRFAGPNPDVAVMPDWVAAIIPDHNTHATHYDEVLLEPGR